MTASEFAFLAIGLLVGGAVGAALVGFLGSRTPAPHEVRVTVAPDAIPRRRSSTLADDAFAPIRPAAPPARGGPADRRFDEAVAAVNVERRTPVPSDSLARQRPVGEPVFRLSAPPGSADDYASRVASARQAVPVSGGADPMMTALRAKDAAVAAAQRLRAAVPVPRSGGSSAAGGGRGSAAVLDGPSTPDRPSPAAARDNDGGPPAGTDAAAAIAAPTTAPAGPCAEPRMLADERCELATRARAAASTVEDALRVARRVHDEHEAAASTASSAADGRAVRHAKDEAQARFRTSRAESRTTEELDSTARAWLLEINAINGRARQALTLLTRERDTASEIAARLERLSLDAEAARIAAETAEAACLSAREAVADCEEREATGPRGHMPVLPPSDPDDAPVGGGGAAALGTSGSPRIFRLLRGDRTAMAEMVAALGGDDAGERRRWQLAISDLIDAIVADSIAASSLVFPPDHPFWGPFTPEQDREIAGALASLGYRFDGLGGWVDERVPSQRDLSLALGYAGIDPMRLRNWPTESEMIALYRHVEVAAAEHVSNSAGDLTLGELVSMLGRRADGLAEVWNHWGKIRPLLLEDK